MPDFVAKPLHVVAYQILSVRRRVGVPHIVLDVPENCDPYVVLSDRQLANRFPVPGDYYVVLDDGYAFVSPRHIFELKYSEIGRPGTLRQDLRSPFAKPISTRRYEI